MSSRRTQLRYRRRLGLDCAKPIRRNPMNMRALMIASLAVLTPAAAIPAFAHHSYAEFDTDKKMTLAGTVKEFQWTNPHSWLLVNVQSPKGDMEQWAVELSS